MLQSVRVDENGTRFQRGQAVPGDGTFDAVLKSINALGPASVEAVGQTTGRQDYASLTHAATTGTVDAMSYASSTGAQPYMGISSPLNPAGYTPSAPDALGSYSGSGGYTGYYGSDVGTSYGATGAGLPTDPFLQQDFLLNKMRATNMEMIVLQAEVQRISREFQTYSNVMQARHRAAINSITNIRG